MAELYDLTAFELNELFASRKASAREIALSAFTRIDAVEPRVNAFLTQTRDSALEVAEGLDRRLAAGEPAGPLAGVPLAVKDVICTLGVRTTCGSRILENFSPPYDATVISLLREAGAILIGKTNCDEFAMGSSTENSAFRPTHNPWDLTRVPGGSSGGSSAAVAAGEAAVALGSDTGGSIRQPAALCGVVGLKPTYGRVSRYGLVAYASSLDQIGPLTRSVRDCAFVMNAIARHDASDSTSVTQEAPNYLASCRAGVKGLRVGVPREFFLEGVEPAVAHSIRASIDLFTELGAIVEECSLPSTEHALACYYIIAPAEASSNLARYDGVKYGYRTPHLAGHVGLTEKSRSEGFGDEVKQRIMIGTYALSAGYYDAYYKRAQQVRTLIRREFDAAFARHDILLTPTSPTTAFRIGEKSNDPLAMKLADVCTLPVNLAGVPAISLPCGFADGLPIGLQLIGKPFDEATLIRAAYTHEQATDWHRRRPDIARL